MLLNVKIWKENSQMVHDYDDTYIWMGKTWEIHSLSDLGKRKFTCLHDIYNGNYDAIKS